MLQVSLGIRSIEMKSRGTLEAQLTPERLELLKKDASRLPGPTFFREFWMKWRADCAVITTKDILINQSSLDR
jgi:hypothetical protein